MRFEQMPRIRLTELPTPLERLERFSAALGGPKVLMKRDDLTSLGFGGNKVRKLEYIMADAMASGADVVITTGGVQTNHGRLTAAAARKLGMMPVLVLSGEEPGRYAGNLLLDYLYGADIRFVPSDMSLPPGERAAKQKADADEAIYRAKEEYETRGHKCYVIPLGGMMRIATAGYINATLEICGQLSQMGEKADYLVVATGSTSTASSLVLANRAFNTGVKVLGMSVWMPADECRRRILAELEEDSRFYGYGLRFSEEDVTVLDDYIGAGYSIPSQGGLEAMRLLAQTEAILVDYAYTGKALAGLVDLSRRGYFAKDDTVLFLHTGGAPAVFAMDRKDFEGR